MATRRDILTAGVIYGAAIPLASRAFAQSDVSTLQRVRSSKVLRVGAVPDGVPYYQKSIADGSWRGFNVDICKKLADSLGARLEINETTWGNSVLDLQAGKIDVFFGLNRTPEREKAIDFSEPVIKNAYSLVVRNALEIGKWEDINKPEIRIAVDAGSSHDAAVTRFAPKATILRLKTQSDATAAVQAGRADMQCLVLMLALGLRAKNPAVGKLVVPNPVAHTESHGGFRREGSKEWQDYVNRWIVENRANGFIGKVVKDNMALIGVKPSDIPEGISF